MNPINIKPKKIKGRQHRVNIFKCAM